MEENENVEWQETQEVVEVAQGNPPPAPADDNEEWRIIDTREVETTSYGDAPIIGYEDGESLGYGEAPIIGYEDGEDLGYGEDQYIYAQIEQFENGEIIGYEKGDPIFGDPPVIGYEQIKTGIAINTGGFTVDDQDGNWRAAAIERVNNIFNEYFARYGDDAINKLYEHFGNYNNTTLTFDQNQGGQGNKITYSVSKTSTQWITVDGDPIYGVAEIIDYKQGDPIYEQISTGFINGAVIETIPGSHLGFAQVPIYGEAPFLGYGQGAPIFGDAPIIGYEMITIDVFQKFIRVEIVMIDDDDGGTTGGGTPGDGTPDDGTTDDGTTDGGVTPGPGLVVTPLVVIPTAPAPAPAPAPAAPAPAPAPAPVEIIDIVDEPVPLAPPDTPAEPDDFVTLTIEEPEVPLAPPITGEVAGFVTTGIIMAALIAAVIGNSIRKMRTEETEEQEV